MKNVILFCTICPKRVSPQRQPKLLAPAEPIRIARNRSHVGVRIGVPFVKNSVPMSVP